MKTGVVALLTLVFCMAWSDPALAQKKTAVKGRVLNENSEPMPYATAVLLSTDSVMQGFGLTNEQGKFRIDGVVPGPKILQITFVGYRMYREPVTITETGQLGDLQMEQEDVALGTVEVEDEMVPMQIKDDTIQYNANAFATQPNAAVEDLLKQLPGVEVDSDGNVTAQGEQVQRVLVDGKEFFGDDPKMATKNLPADAIKSVQVYDQQSDMAEFTGIDDGNETKTINLELKEGKKAGYFGNTTGGYGYPDDRFEGKVSLNQFTKKTQMSIIGMGNNINDQGFSIDDYVNFMGGFRNLMQSGLASFQDGQPTTNFNSSLNDGITTTYAGGLNFNYDLSKKTSWTSNYFFNRINNELQSTTSRQYFNNANQFDSQIEDDQVTESDNHRLNFRLDHELDSTQDLRWRGNLTYNTGSTTLDYNQQSLSNENVLQNANNTQNEGTGNSYNFGTNLLYRKKLGKAGKNLVVRANMTLAADKMDSELRSINSLLSTDSILGTRLLIDTLSQTQDYTEDQFNYGGEVRYTHPLGKARYLEVSYLHQENNTNLDKDFFDIDPDSRNEVLNETLSNAYDNVFRYDQLGTTLRINRDKYNFSIGLAGQMSTLKGDIIDRDTNVEQRFENLLPNMRFDYRFRNSQRLRFSYRTGVNEPSIAQLQPVVDNSNPFNIYIGNPDLLAEYEHRVNLRYISFSQFTFTSLFASLSGTYTENKITNEVTIDDSFVQTSRPINVDQEMVLNARAGFDRPIKSLGVKYGISPGSRYTRSILFVNGTENNSDRFVSSLRLELENRKKEKWDATIGVSFSHNLTEFSENTDLNQEFLTTNYFADLTLNLPKNWRVGSSFDYTLYQGEAFSETEAIPVWRAEVSRIFLKNDRGQLKFRVFDLLNQNQGFSRNSTFNYIEEVNSNALGRYYMLSFTYSLTQLGKSQTPHRMPPTRSGRRS